MTPEKEKYWIDYAIREGAYMHQYPNLDHTWRSLFVSAILDFNSSLNAERERAERAEGMCDALNKALALARGTK